MAKPGTSPDPSRIRKIAEEYYRSGQYYCSEAIVKTINDEFGFGYPDDIVKLASGFSIGMGSAGCACGAVTGGVMALGMVFGREEPGDPSIDRCLAFSRELHAFFIQPARLHLLPYPDSWHGPEIARTSPAMHGTYR